MPYSVHILKVSLTCWSQEYGSIKKSCHLQVFFPIVKKIISIWISLKFQDQNLFISNSLKPLIQSESYQTYDLPNVPGLWLHKNTLVLSEYSQMVCVYGWYAYAQYKITKNAALYLGRILKVNNFFYLIFPLIFN